MNEQQQHASVEAKTRQSIVKKPRILVLNLYKSPAAYAVLLLLSYVLGYFSRTQPLTPPPHPPQLLSTLPAASRLDNFRFTTQCATPVPVQVTRQLIIDRVFNGTSPYDNFPPKQLSEYLSSSRRRRITGWGSNGAVFARLVEKVKPRVIIEVGTFLGASAIHMAELAQRKGLDTVILCVDDFRGWPGFLNQFDYIDMINGDVLLLYHFMNNVVHKNVSGSVLPLPFSTGSILERFCEWGVFGDLIEIDAGHDFNSAWADINRAYRVLRRPGGVIFGHDYFTAADNRGVRRAVNLFAEMNGLKVKIDGQHWVIDPN